MTVGWLELTTPPPAPTEPTEHPTLAQPTSEPLATQPAQPAPAAETAPAPTVEEETAAAITPEPSSPPAPAPVPAAIAPPPTPAPEAETETALLPRLAPDPALIEPGPDGPLPRMGQDGRTPWQAYARPFDKADGRPRIAVVLGNLGISDAATETVIQQLPGAVTLAFSPYAGRKIGKWIELARAAGHEVLLSLPMVPVDYPRHAPGPQALLTSLTSAQNLERLKWALSRFTGYVGVTNYMGSRFTASEPALRPILGEINRRGLLFLDSRSASRSVASNVAEAIGLPRAINDRFIDAEASRPAIDKRLAEVEAIARRKGRAVAIGFPYPVTIERISAWSRTLEGKGLVLAPVSAVVSVGGKGG